MTTIAFGVLASSSFMILITWQKLESIHAKKDTIFAFTAVPLSQSRVATRSHSLAITATVKKVRFKKLFKLKLGNLLRLSISAKRILINSAGVEAFLSIADTLVTTKKL